jgi:hypothetical protein
MIGKKRFHRTIPGTVGSLPCYVSQSPPTPPSSDALRKHVHVPICRVLLVSDTEWSFAAFDAQTGSMLPKKPRRSFYAESFVSLPNCAERSGSLLSFSDFVKSRQRPPWRLVDLPLDLVWEIVQRLDILSAFALATTCHSMYRTIKSSTSNVLGFTEVVVNPTSPRMPGVPTDLLPAMVFFSASLTRICIRFCSIDETLMCSLKSCSQLQRIELLGVTAVENVLDLVVEYVTIESFPHLQAVFLKGSIEGGLIFSGRISEWFLNANNLLLDFGQCYFRDCDYVGEKCDSCGVCMCRVCFPFAMCYQCEKNYCFDCQEVETCEICCEDFCSRCRNVSYCRICDRSTCDQCGGNTNCPGSDFASSSYY